METTQLPHLGLRAAKKLNPKLDVAAHVLKRRHQGRETYSPTGENSI